MEKVYNYLSRFLDFWPCASEFEKGFRSAMMLAALVFLLLIVLAVILKLIFRKPAVPGVTLLREDGDIFISRNAIYTAICRLEKEFSEFEILKVNMHRTRTRDLGLTITVLYEEQDRSFDAAAAALKQRVFDMLTRSFGSERVKSVSIVLAKIPGRDADEDNDDTAVTGNAFISGV